MPTKDSVVVKIAKLIDSEDEKANDLPYEVRRTFSHFAGAVAEMAESNDEPEAEAEAESTEEVTPE